MVLVQVNAQRPAKSAVSFRHWCFLSVFLRFRFIILACDGLFKVFSADEAVKYVLGVLQVFTLMTFISKNVDVSTST